MSNLSQLSTAQLGWRAFFNLQLSLDEIESSLPARVIQINADTISLLSEQGEILLTKKSIKEVVVAGDWLLLNQAQGTVRLLDRETELFADDSETEVILANLDTMMIVAAMNDTFDLESIRKSVLLAHQAHIETVVVLTHKDACADPYEYIDQVQSIRHDLIIESMNAKDIDQMSRLMDWFAKGQTVALVGNEKGGKSAILKSLLAATQTSDDQYVGQPDQNQLYRLENAGFLFQSPMLQALFANIGDKALSEEQLLSLAKHCKFGDCTHTVEPGCAVRKAMATGDLVTASHATARNGYDDSEDSDADRRALDKKAGKDSKALHSISRKNKKELSD